MSRTICGRCGHPMHWKDCPDCTGLCRNDESSIPVVADTPDPRPSVNVASTANISIPVLTTEEVRATNALFEAMREAGLFGRKRQAVEDAAHHLAAVARAAARAAPQADDTCSICGALNVNEHGAGCLAAPQADANLEGYWERAYWEIVPKLQTALVSRAGGHDPDDGLPEDYDIAENGAILPADPRPVSPPSELTADPWTVIHDNGFSWDDVNALASIFTHYGWDIYAARGREGGDNT